MTAKAAMAETYDDSENTGTEAQALDEQTQPSEEYNELRDKLKDLRSRVEEGYWDLSIGLHEVFHKSIYMMWGYNTWQEYVETELDFQLRKAQYLVGIQEWFGNMKPSIQDWVRNLGWTKAKELVKIVTPENAATWKKKLSGKSFTQMMEIIKEHKAKESGKQGSGEENEADANKPVRRAFKLLPSQAANVEAAIEKAKEAGETDKDGSALDLICTDYLATNQGIDSIEQYLAKIEKSIGVQLIAYHEGDDAVVYGYELCQKLAGGEAGGEGDGEAAADDNG